MQQGSTVGLDPGRRARLQRRTVRVLIVAQVVGTIGVGIAPSIGVLLAGAVTSDEAWAGLARTASTLGAALFGLPLGTLAARRGRRAALSLGWFAAAAGSAVIVVAAQRSSALLLFPGLLLIGCGSAVSLQSRFAAADLAEPHRAGRDLALVVWVGTIGSVLGPNLGVPGDALGGAVGLNGFAAAFLIATVCLAAAGVVVLVALRPDPLLVANAAAATGPARAGGRRPPRRHVAELAHVLRTNAAARTAVLTILTAQVVMVAVMTMTPVHLEHQGGSVTVVGLTISLHIAGMYALAPLVGSVVDRRGARTAVLVGLLVLLVSLLLAALAPDDLRAVVVSLVLLGIGWSFLNVSGSAMFTRSVPPATRAASQGGVDASSNLAGAAAAFLAGPLLAATGFSVLGIVALAMLVPLVVVVGRDRTPDRRTPDDR
ncbi:MFS transporter [Kineococcus sp. SYSU DK001]|uniref:MFS transporter n=1 Tax=Kineococcus sp. SYSU DK001 TaxID=3383122 RepID=UPI003D7EA154